jgi:hypothetical protein
MPYRVYDYHCPFCGVMVRDCMVKSEFLDTECEKQGTKCPDCDKQMNRLMPAPPWKWTAGARGF